MRLSKENVERQINEMWDALADNYGSDPDYDATHARANEVERELRKRLAVQEFMDEHAPEAFAYLEKLLDWCREHTSPTDPNSPHNLLVDCACLIGLLKEKRDA